MHIKFSFILLINAISIITTMPLMAADDFYLNNMKSPQISDMFRYGNVETSLFTGKLNLEIPIYTLNDPDFNLDIALRYNSEGFKPTKQSGYVGCGWFLEAGGCITREVKGFADEMKRQDAFSSFNYIGMLSFIRENQLDVNKLFNLDPSVFQSDDYRLGDSYKDDIDYLPDIFHFKFCGYHGSFLINNKGEAIIIEGDFVTIDLSRLIDCSNNIGMTFTPPSSSQITIHTLDGYTYIFGGTLSALEYALKTDISTQSFISQQAPITNTWHLSKIIAPNRRQVNFYYKSCPLLLDNYTSPLFSFSEYYDNFAGSYNYNTSISGSNSTPNVDASLQRYVTKECILDSIVLKYPHSLKIEFCSHVDSLKLYPYNNCSYNYVLDTIRIKINEATARVAELSSIYKHSVDNNGNPYNYWRFLSSVKVQGSGEYSFLYNHQGNYPFIGLSASNYQNKISTFGYYNNAPYLGLLTEVTYPTGGKQKFRYALHQCSVERCYMSCQGGNVKIEEISNFSLPIGRGVRIEHIESYQDNILTEQKSYLYSIKNSTMSSGIYYNTSVTRNGIRPEVGDELKNALNYSFLNNHIAYSTVKEKTIYPTTNETNDIIYSYNVGSKSYDSSWDSNIRRGTSQYSDNENAAILSGMLVYDDKLVPNGQLLAIEHYKNGELVNSRQLIYNGIANGTGLIPNDRDTTFTSTDTIVVFANHHIPITRKLIVNPPILIQEITKDFLTTNRFLSRERKYTYDSKLRIKKEQIINSDERINFTKYIYPDDILHNPSSVDDSNPYALLIRKRLITKPIETLSGYMDGTQEKVASTKINLFITREYNPILYSPDSIIPSDSPNLLDSLPNIMPDSTIVGSLNIYPSVYKTLELQTIDAINDYQPVSVVNDSLRYDSRFRLTCTYEFDSMLRLTSITPVNNVTTSYTWDGIYPVSKTVGNQTSTFSYIPYVGMSSMTDARGVTTYYEYDKYGRLIEVYRLSDGKKEILNKYIYHIKSEPQL